MMTPHPHQVSPIEKGLTTLTTIGRALIVMATGLGKTIVAAFITKELLKLGRGLFLCHLNPGLEQSLKQFRDVLGDDARLGVFHGEKKHWEETDILFASFQTFTDWKHAFFENEFAFVVVDESHHGQAPTYKDVITYFKPKALLALTATPDRMDQKDIREIFGQEVVNITLEEGIAKGWLAAVEYHLVTDNLDRKALREIAKNVLHGKKISMKQLNETIFIEARDEKVAEIILGYGKKKTIVFCENTRHADNFQKFLPGSRAYHSKIDAATNTDTLEAFRRGECQCILVVNKMNECIDIPDAELIVFLRSTDSKTIYLQQLGRGLRKTLDKRKVIVLDFVANANRVMVVREMIEGIESFTPNWAELETAPHYVKGKTFEFIFTDEQIDLFKVLERLQPRRISDIPELLAEYSPRNPVPANEVIASSYKLVWWRCTKCGHEWEAYAVRRLEKEDGCPGCAGTVLTPHNNLAVLHPELLPEYSEKNKLLADQILPKSKTKVLWRCTKCGHEWTTWASTRAIWKHGCPICCVDLAEHIGQSLEYKKPRLAREYSDKNPVSPDKIRFSANQIVWWHCPRCGTEWQASCASRVFAQSRNPCPTCGRQ